MGGAGIVERCDHRHDALSRHRARTRSRRDWVHWYAETHQRTHVNTTCKLLLLAHAFDTVGCKVVGLRTDNFNFRSQRAIEALGAKKDGVLRHFALRRNGTVRDMVMYSILASEWPDVRRHLELRLQRHSRNITVEIPGVTHAFSLQDITHARLVVAVLLATQTVFSARAETRASQRESFALEEATIGRIHGALASGAITCAQLVRAYLDRIEAYDDKGPTLRAIISINPRALELAKRWIERVPAPTTRLPLHCIPIILKDNFDTADMPTTGGSVTLANSVPPDDAFVVKRFREAGAIILPRPISQSWR